MPMVGEQVDVLGCGGAVEEHGVCAVLALDGVATIAGIPGEGVVATAEIGRVVPLAADDVIVAGAAVERLGSGPADQLVVAGAAGDCGRDRRERAVGAVDAAVGVVNQHGVIARVHLYVYGAQMHA